MEELKELKQMLDAGLIEQREYDTAKAKIMSNFVNTATGGGTPPPPPPKKKKGLPPPPRGGSPNVPPQRNVAPPPRGGSPNVPPQRNVAPPQRNALPPRNNVPPPRSTAPEPMPTPGRLNLSMFMNNMQSSNTAPPPREVQIPSSSGRPPLPTNQRTNITPPPRNPPLQNTPPPPRNITPPPRSTPPPITSTPPPPRNNTPPPRNNTTPPRNNTPPKGNNTNVKTNNPPPPLSAPPPPPMTGPPSDPTRSHRPSLMTQLNTGNSANVTLVSTTIGKDTKLINPSEDQSKRELREMLKQDRHTNRIKNQGGGGATGGGARHRKESVSTFMATNLGYDSENHTGFRVEIVGTAERIDLSTQKPFIVYEMIVTEGSKKSKVFRRYIQFAEVDVKLKKKGLLPKRDPSLPPKKRARTEGKEQFLEVRQRLLADYISMLCNNAEISKSQYLFNFLGPFQIGDIKSL